MSSAWSNVLTISGSGNTIMRGSSAAHGQSQPVVALSFDFGSNRKGHAACIVHNVVGVPGKPRVRGGLR